jgi:N-acetylneuraminic acid mutarotase
MKKMMNEIDVDDEILKDLNLLEQDKKAYQTIMQSYMSVRLKRNLSNLNS